ncbi:MAG: hypothetical protein EA353_02115 [Puniceicoccaceae bacterium]|nr:MAG: hypothetical protein EA353_02115 [Puniceicoccaceae bacterium]
MSLNFPGPAPVEIVESDVSDDRQFKTPTAVAELRAEPAGGSSISFFRRDAETGLDAAGFSEFSEGPYLVWQITMPATGDVDLLQLDVIKSYNGSQVSYQFTEDFAPSEGIRFQRFVAGNGLRTVEKTYYEVPKFYREIL